MSAITASKKFRLSGANNTHVCDHLYAYYDFALEADNEVITDRSGNGHNLVWYGAGAVPGGYRNDGYLHLPTPLTAFDVFGATTAAAFPFIDTTQSSIYVVRFADASPAATGANIIGKRGGISGPADAGFQLRRDTGTDLNLAIYDGSATPVINGDVSVTNIPTAEVITALIAHEASTDTWTISAASKSTFRQFALVAAVVGSATNYASATSVLTIGQRNSTNASELYDDLYVYSFQAYHDASGKALPSNLGAVCRFLYQNPKALIPSGLWP